MVLPSVVVGVGEGQLLDTALQFRLILACQVNNQVVKTRVILSA